MTTPEALSTEDLHAYVDGQLNAPETSRVESWLAKHPDDAAAVLGYRLQNTRLHGAFDAVLDEPVPPDLTAIVSAHKSRPQRRVAAAPWFRLAASVLLLLSGAVGGWLLHGAMGSGSDSARGTFVDQAFGAHRVFVAEVRHPVEVPASEASHLVAWLSKRLNTPLKAPDLKDVGFSLVGGRLLAEGARPVAQFMYEEPGGGRLTVYVRGMDGSRDTSFRFAAQDGVSAFYWIEKDFAYALVAPVGRERLSEIANKAYRDLNRL